MLRVGGNCAAGPCVEALLTATDKEQIQESQKECSQFGTGIQQKNKAPTKFMSIDSEPGQAALI